MIEERDNSRDPVVLVLHKTPETLTTCGRSFSIEASKTSTGSIKITKSSWTYAVEGAVEYCRIVFDLFPCTCKVLLLVCAANGPVPMNSWDDDDQHLTQVLEQLAHVGAPTPTSESLPGLSAALLSLGSLFHRQSSSSSAMQDHCGRVVVITPIARPLDIGTTARSILQALREHNNLPSSNKSCALQHVNVTFLYTSPAELLPQVEKAVLPPQLSLTVQSCLAPRLSTVMSMLCQQHYKMASTVITGIPMKEEQHGGASSAYDVELLHEASVHKELLPLGLPTTSTTVEGVPHRSVTLRWSTPRSTSLDVQFCSHSCRVTPVEVNSRPSTCLFNFVLAGKGVLMLQQAQG